MIELLLCYCYCDTIEGFYCRHADFWTLRILHKRCSIPVYPVYRESVHRSCCLKSQIFIKSSVISMDAGNFVIKMWFLCKIVFPALFEIYSLYMCLYSLYIAFCEVVVLVCVTLTWLIFSFLPRSFLITYLLIRQYGCPSSRSRGKWSTSKLDQRACTF